MIVERKYQLTYSKPKLPFYIARKNKKARGNIAFKWVNMKFVPYVIHMNLN